MKKTKIASVVSMSMVTTALLSACMSGNTDSPAANSGGSGAAGSDSKPKLDISFVWQDSVVPTNVPTLRDKELEKKFNVKLSPQYVLWEQNTDKFNVMFASGQYPELLMNFNAGSANQQMKKWGQNGYLLNLKDHLDKIPNYRKLFSNEEWEIMLKYVTTEDGKMFYLPGQNLVKMQRDWIYRKDVFEKEGLKPPATMDELYQTLKTLKAKFPDSVPMSNRWAVDGLVAGFKQAYRTHTDFWRNPENNQIEYGPASNNYRDMLVFLNKLYKEGLIEKEFATITGPQWEEKNFTGKSLIEYSYGTRISYFEDKNKAVAGTDWELAPQLIRGYSDKPALAEKELPFYISGAMAITSAAKGEKLDKVLEMINWICSPEGIRFMEAGLEGQQHELVNGKPKLKPGFTEVSTMLKETGFHFSLGRETGWAEKTAGDQINDKILSMFGGEPSAPFVFFTFKEEDEKVRQSLYTGLNDKRLEFSQKAIMGAVDPSKDDVWSKYLQDLEKAGLSKLTEIHKNSAK
ncbi:extracellular solute-binding protein [Paenibacillus silviterrae]|uniref:extracellular solute-binding protein n=1 Tax=Paenibacillus silviterrae TaxID=3242194 RepID=UPI002543D08D|nr:extracellular solute-binding protein [Paenibacillus chinjuensis]